MEKRDSVFALGIHFSNSEKVSDKLVSMKNWCFGKDLKQLEEKEAFAIRQDQYCYSVRLSKLIYNASVLPVHKTFYD